MMKLAKQTIPEQRIAQIELLLRWEGRLNRGRVCDLLGLSPIRASELIRLYRDQHPHWVKWDTTHKSYYATPTFYQVGHDSDPHKPENAESLARYFALAGLPNASSASVPADTIALDAFPTLAIPRPKIFAILGEAIRIHRAVEITYRSMRDPSPHQRIIEPHSLVQTGHKWHVRAFCTANQQFRDYALGRVVDAKLLKQQSERAQTDDEAWMTKVPVRLVAHPGLARPQEELIRFEYLNDTASRVVTCRGSLVNYFIQGLRAATDVKTQHPPEYQLAVDNAEEIRPWLFPG